MYPIVLQLVIDDASTIINNVHILSVIIWKILFIADISVQKAITETQYLIHIWKFSKHLHSCILALKLIPTIPGVLDAFISCIWLFLSYSFQSAFFFKFNMFNYFSLSTLSINSNLTFSV